MIIRKLGNSENLHEEYSFFEPIKMQLMWSEMQLLYTKESMQEIISNEGTLGEIIYKLISMKIWKLGEKLHEDFPEISREEVLSMWCELDQICGFEFPDREKQHSLDDVTTVEKVLQKTCQYMYRKCLKANTQCKVKVKGEAEFCSRHI